MRLSVEFLYRVGGLSGVKLEGSIVNTRESLECSDCLLRQLKIITTSLVKCSAPFTHNPNLPFHPFQRGSSNAKFKCEVNIPYYNTTAKLVENVHNVSLSSAVNLSSVKHQVLFLDSILTCNLTLLHRNKQQPCVSGKWH